MSKLLIVSKWSIRYNKEQETFEAFGAQLINVPGTPYYTAANPNGLWISGCTMDNSLQPFAFLNWDEIEQIVVNGEIGTMFVVPKTFDDISFKMLPKFFKHKMQKSGKTAFCVSLDLCSQELLAYINQHIAIDFENEKFTDGEQKRNNILSVLCIIALGLILIGFIVDLFA